MTNQTTLHNFEDERQGQIVFYEQFLPRVNVSLDIQDLLIDNTDGVLNGNILEFKLTIGDLNKTLFQIIKYLSAMRVKGKPLPRNIILVDLNNALAYKYDSSDYLELIEKQYFGAASANNNGFVADDALRKYEYETNNKDASELIETLKQNKWTKIHIDENCIVGWAMAYYRQKPEGRKEDFIGDESGSHKVKGEIRQPVLFEEYIYPYKGKTNVKFQYLMDKLNDTLQKKNLGAFYTPDAYARKAHELLRRAIKRVPVGNDYVIIDRCAGTGNLEKDLTDEELSHCILSTVEYYEYKVMQELIGDKVRHIIPPVEKTDTFSAGLVNGADALTKEYIEHDFIQKCIKDDKCTVILFENPPYAEANGTTKISGRWKKSYVAQEMKKKGISTNDLGNAFIWSGFKYFLTQPTDSYVVFSPIKYWKAQHLIDKKFIDGFAFNRRYFHTNIDACISCILWSNEQDKSKRSFTLKGYNLFENDKHDLEIEKKSVKLPIKKIYKTFSESYYDKRVFDDDILDGICLELNGLERLNKSNHVTKRYNNNIIGYLVANGTGFDNPDLNCALTIAGRYDSHGFFLRQDNYLEKLPMFCAGRYITYNRAWTERARVMKSGDGAIEFRRDAKNGTLEQWLLKCLLFTCLEMQNHMRTFTGSDGRFYKNELCFDDTCGKTIASKDIQKLKQNEQEQTLLKQWQTLISAVKQTEEYDPLVTYGVYQIAKEIDTSYKNEKGKRIYNNVEVHSALQTLKTLIKDYYNAEVVPILFDYKFLR